MRHAVVLHPHAGHAQEPRQRRRIDQRRTARIERSVGVPVNGSHPRYRQSDAGLAAIVARSGRARVFIVPGLEGPEAVPQMPTGAASNRVPHPRQTSGNGRRVVA